MKILVRLFKYTLFSAAVSIATCVIALFLGIFFLLHRDSPENRPLGSPTPQGSISDIAASTPDIHALPPPEQKPVDQDSKYQRVLEQFKVIEEIEDDARTSSLRNLCEMICDPPRFKAGHLDFVSFYKAEGRRSFEDTDFRLQLESFLLIKRLIPPETMQIARDIASFDASGRSTSEKMFVALRIEGQVLREIFLMARRMPALKGQNEKLRAVKKLRKQCAEKSAAEIKAACEAKQDALSF